MSKEIEFEDLKGEAERATKKLRYLYRVMNNTESLKDLQPCFEMGIKL